MIMITMGTGIGGGVIADGRLLLGAHGYVGEFGHMMIDPNGPPCPCGQIGCWERYASGSAVALEAKRVAAQGRLGSLAAAAGSIDAITSEQVVAAAAAGTSTPSLYSTTSPAGWRRAWRTSPNAFDPARFVLGGGLSAAGPVFEPLLRRHVAAAVYASSLRPEPDIRFAELGEQAGAIGAALYGAA